MFYDRLTFTAHQLSALLSAVIAMIESVCLSIYLLRCCIMSTKWDPRSPNGSAKTLVFGDVKMLRKFEGYQHEAIFYQYPQSWIRKSWENEHVRCKQAASSSLLIWL